MRRSVRHVAWAECEHRHRVHLAASAEQSICAISSAETKPLTTATCDHAGGRPRRCVHHATLRSHLSWCHNGTMRRMNLRDVPDDVYEALAQAAERNRQSLSGFVVERLTEAAHVLAVSEYLESYVPPRGTGVSVEDAVSAVNESRRAS